MATVDYRTLTASRMTELFLYGERGKPQDFVDDTLLRGPDPFQLVVAAPSYMSDGPGRFVKPAMFALITNFFNSDIFNQTGGVRTTYTAQQMLSIVGGSLFTSIQQYNYDDAKHDIAERTYVWNSTSFGISPDATFVVEADGTRHIENLQIRPADDNFDFSSGNPVACGGR